MCCKVSGCVVTSGYVLLYIIYYNIYIYNGMSSLFLMCVWDLGVELVMTCLYLGAGRKSSLPRRLHVCHYVTHRFALSHKLTANDSVLSKRQNQVLNQRRWSFGHVTLFRQTKPWYGASEAMCWLYKLSDSPFYLLGHSSIVSFTFSAWTDSRPGHAHIPAQRSPSGLAAG